MRRKKLIAVMAAAALLGGCSESAEPSGDSPEESSAVTTATTTAAAESQPEEEPEEKDELYDTSPISQAYLTGDTSGLDELQLEIYELASAALDELVTDGMTDYEKELAVHDYIVVNTTYDTKYMGIFKTHAPHADDPYGALAGGKCICSGYTTAFRLFMDMLEIPCMSIKATSDDGEEHAWNMVEINGHWYYVDVTWDDPVPDIKGRPIQHKYFNISREDMALRHNWDSSGYPETDSEEDSYVAHNLRTVNSAGEVGELMERTLAEGNENVYFVPTEPEGWSLEQADGFDTYVPADLINEELAAVSESFLQEHSDLSLKWHRLDLEGRVIVAVDMIKQIKR